MWCVYVCVFVRFSMCLITLLMCLCAFACACHSVLVRTTHLCVCDRVNLTTVLAYSKPFRAGKQLSTVSSTSLLLGNWSGDSAVIMRSEEVV
jgi:hypothetical protein